MDRQIAISQFVADSIDEPCLVIPNGVRPTSLPPTDRDHTVVLLQRLETEIASADDIERLLAAVRDVAGDGWQPVRSLMETTDRPCSAAATETLVSQNAPGS